MNIQTFSFANQSLQIIIKDNQAWFIAREVANLLGYRDAHNLTRILDDDEKGTHNMSTLGGNQDVTIINESGFYHAAFKSRKAEVKPFRKWVTNEILPSIRKTGSYTVSDNPKKLSNKTTTTERTGLRNAVNLLVSKKGLNYSEAYSMVHQRFNVESIEDLSRSQLNEAVEYVHRVVLEGEVLDKEPTPPAYPCNLMSLLKHAEYVFQWLMHHEPAIRLFNDTLACNLIGRVFDGYCCAADTAKKIGFKFQSYEYWRAYPFDGDNDTIRRYYELNAA